MVKPVGTVQMQADYTQPAQSAESVTPGTPLTNGSTRGLWIGGAGNVAVTMVSGDTVTFSGIVAGTLLPVMVTAVASSGTTATLIIALY